MKTQIILGLMVVGAMGLTSCSKDEGTGGKAHIHGAVEIEATEAAVVNTPIYIWYGASSAAGTADASTNTDTEGGFEFENLTKGDYYLSCTYVDTSGVTLTGGAAVTISKKKGEVEQHIHLE